MSIKPIDLQTLFVKMDEVSKEQSQAKEQAALQQSQAARAQIAKELAEDRRVTESPDDREAESVKEGSGKDSREEKERAKDKDEKDGTGGDEEGREIVKDPDVGRHIDLSG